MTGMELAVGRVAKAHGVRGEVAVEVRTDSPEERFASGANLTGRRGRSRSADTELTVEAARNHSGRLLVRFVGVESREAADALRGTMLLVDSADIDAPEDPDEFADHQLIGLDAVAVTGELLGTVTDVLHTPAGELLELALSGGGEALVPFVLVIVPEVDLEAKRVVIDPPEGLFEQD